MSSQTRDWKLDLTKHFFTLLSLSLSRVSHIIWATLSCTHIHTHTHTHTYTYTHIHIHTLTYTHIHTHTHTYTHIHTRTHAHVQSLFFPQVFLSIVYKSTLCLLRRVTTSKAKNDFSHIFQFFSKPSIDSIGTRSQVLDILQFFTFQTFKC